MATTMWLREFSNLLDSRAGKHVSVCEAVMRKAGIIVVMLLSVAAAGQAPLGAQGRKIGDFANVPEPPSETIISCGALIDGTGGPTRKHVDVVVQGNRIERIR